MSAKGPEEQGQERPEAGPEKSSKRGKGSKAGPEDDPGRGAPGAMGPPHSPHFPLPDPAWEPTRGFFAAAARGELAIPRCADCRARVWYPRPACPACGSGDLAWEPVSGRGTLFSFAVVRRPLWRPFADRVPYATGLVALAEDPAVRLVTLLVDCAPEELRVEMAVHAVFRPLRFPGAETEVTVPLFTPDPAPR